MSLTEEDKAWVRSTAEAIVREVSIELFKSHVMACPHGKTLLIMRWLVIGLLLGIGVASGVTWAMAIKLLMTIP